METQTLRADAATAFIADAEAAFNAKDLDAACAAYTTEAVVESYTNGIQDRLVGLEEIRHGWQAIFKALPDFTLKKTIVRADDRVIINEWAGTLDRRGRHPARGIETWWFDAEGRVVRHRLYSSLHEHKPEAWLGKLRFSLVHPIVGFRLERERRRLRRRPT